MNIVVTVADDNKNSIVRSIQNITHIADLKTTVNVVR